MPSEHRETVTELSRFCVTRCELGLDTIETLVDAAASQGR
jgi:hypothetical protein